MDQLLLELTVILIWWPIKEESINTAQKLKIWEDMQLKWLDLDKQVPEWLIILFKTHGDQAGVKVDSSDSKLILMKVTLKLMDIQQLNIENYKL